MMLNKLIQDLNKTDYCENYLYENNEVFNQHFLIYLNEIKTIEYLILGENPLSFDTYVYNNKGKGGYIDLINKAFDIVDCKPENRLELWAEKGILFLDIYQLFDNKGKGFDLNSKMKKITYRDLLRKSKINYQKTNINYPVFRLKVAISYLNEKIEFKELKDFKIAVMMPQLTSLPIFNYFSDEKNKIKLKEIEFSNIFRQLNSLETYKKIGENGEYIIIPLHKVNTISGSNNPRFELIKYALDLYDNN
jgi:hypothetical protein